MNSEAAELFETVTSTFQKFQKSSMCCWVSTHF